jgi:hypothetical protein
MTILSFIVEGSFATLETELVNHELDRSHDEPRMIIFTYIEISNYGK